MECYNCGFQLPADAQRCPQCGQRFQPRAEQARGAADGSLLARLKRWLGMGR